MLSNESFDVSMWKYRNHAVGKISQGLSRNTRKQDYMHLSQAVKSILWDFWKTHPLGIPEC